MKRFLAAVGILLIIIGISIYTLVDMQQSIDRLTEHTAAVRQQVEKEGCRHRPAPMRGADGDGNGMDPGFCCMCGTTIWIISWSTFPELPAYCLEDDRPSC